MMNDMVKRFTLIEYITYMIYFRSISVVVCSLKNYLPHGR